MQTFHSSFTLDTAGVQFGVVVFSILYGRRFVHFLVPCPPALPSPKPHTWFYGFITDSSEATDSCSIKFFAEEKEKREESARTRVSYLSKSVEPTVCLTAEAEPVPLNSAGAAAIPFLVTSLDEFLTERPLRQRILAVFLAPLFVFGPEVFV